LATIVVEKVATLVQQCHSRPPPPTNKKQRRIENKQMQKKLKRTMSSMTGQALGSVQEPVLICIRRQNKLLRALLRFSWRETIRSIGGEECAMSNANNQTQQF
jgi:hypothetical protein